MHLLLPANFGDFVPKVFLVVVGDLRGIENAETLPRSQAVHGVLTCIQVTGSPRFSFTGMTPVLTTSSVMEAAGTVDRSIIRNLEDITLTASRCVAEDSGMESTDIICKKAVELSSSSQAGG